MIIIIVIIILDVGGHILAGFWKMNQNLPENQLKHDFSVKQIKKWRRTDTAATLL